APPAEPAPASESSWSSPAPASTPSWSSGFGSGSDDSNN
ncbi:MAG TPA: histone, partial [Afipia sp.]|nr:histone [Afipia sp.]